MLIVRVLILVLKQCGCVPMRVVSELLIAQYHHVWVVNERIEEVCCLDQRQSAMTKWSDARIHSNSYKPKTFPLPDQRSKTMHDTTNCPALAAKRLHTVSGCSSD